MEVLFHSDASNNDWGVRLSAYGILQVRSFCLLTPQAKPRDKHMAQHRLLAAAKTCMSCPCSGDGGCSDQEHTSISYVSLVTNTVFVVFSAVCVLLVCFFFRCFLIVFAFLRELANSEIMRLRFRDLCLLWFKRQPGGRGGGDGSYADKNHVGTLPPRRRSSAHTRGRLPPAVSRRHPSSNQEPTAHQRAAYRDKRKEVGDPETELSCWLLEALAKESEGDYVKSLMHQRSTMETLARYVWQHPIEFK